MRKKAIYITIASLAVAIIIATASSIFHKPIPKPVEIKKPTIRLNQTVTNADSDIPELAGLDKKVNYYMRKWQFKGASLAITRGDSLVYAKGYGIADNGVDMEPGHILRMASVSKLLTAVGIMVLQDKGMLSIKDTVFGPSGILKDTLFAATIKDKNHYKITVEHLLRHQGGFHRDPVFSSRDVKNQMQLDHAPEKEDFYRLVLSRKLRFIPGSWQKYSNFGYILLSDIIEVVSGMPYEEFMKKEVLAPAGCFDMHISQTYYNQKRPNEVRYYTHEGDGQFIEEYNGSGKIVERCYGGNNIPLLSGAGAWCGSPIEIARLVASIDGDHGVPDIISSEAIAQMTEYFDTETFSLGWNDTNPDKGWSRSGTLSGTCAFVKRFPDGECWILITNTSSWKGPKQASYTNELFRQCRDAYSAKLPKQNLFE